MKNHTVLTAVFFMLAGLASAAGAQSGERVTVDLKQLGGRLLVPVQAPDGTTLDFYISTGTPVTVLSQSGAARVGSQKNVTLGGLRIPTGDASIVPDANLTVAGKVLDGIIGSNTLNEYNVLFDLPNERLLLEPFGRSVSWDGVMLSDPIRVRVYHGVVIGLDVSFGGKDYPAALDIGSPTLVVNERVQSETRFRNTGVLRIGNKTFTDVPARVEDSDILRRWSPDGAGFVIVGAPIASNCAISLSYVHRELRTCVR